MTISHSLHALSRDGALLPAPRRPYSSLIDEREHDGSPPTVLRAPAHPLETNHIFTIARYFCGNASISSWRPRAARIAHAQAWIGAIV
jgi:hypothetical protein